MPVFISYHRPDEVRAQYVDFYLASKGIKTYLDLTDPKLQTASSISARLVEKLSGCTHLLAIISETTKDSWWVPFEIGVATKDSRRITSYLMANVVLPEYLDIWPVLHNSKELDLYADYYWKDVESVRRTKSFQESTRAPIQTADQFHQQLKASLRYPR